MASTRTVGFGPLKRQSVFDDKNSKRTSIYYTGAKPARAAKDFIQPSCTTSGNLGNKQATATPSKPVHHVPDSTLDGDKDGGVQDKNVNERKPFAIPLRQYPARQITTSKETPLLQEPANPFLNVAFMTPSRGVVESRSQTAPSSCKKQVSWSDVLTPLQQHVAVSNKGSILKKCASQARCQSEQLSCAVPTSTTASKDISFTSNEPTIDSATIAMKLFSGSDTPTEISREKSKLHVEELERQALEDLKRLEMVENQATRPPGALGTPSINISGCVPLTSPPDVPGLPVTTHTLQSTNRSNWIEATPQNHMHVTVRRATPQESPYTYFKEPNRPRKLTTPAPIRTPLRMTSTGDVAFGLLSSIKKSAPNRPCPPSSFNTSVLLRDTICSSTPAILVEPAAPVPCDSYSTNRLSTRHGNQADFGSVTNCHGNANETSDPRDLRSIKNDEVLQINKDNVQLIKPIKIAAVPQRSTTLAHARTSRPFQPVHCTTNGPFEQDTSRVPSDLKRNIAQFYSEHNSVNGESLSLRSSLEHSQANHKRYIPSCIAESTPQQVAQVEVVSLPAQPFTTLTEQALLDTEITLYSSLGSKNRGQCRRDVANPIRTLLSYGDPQHFVPICLCTETLHCPVHPATHR